MVSDSVDSFKKTCYYINRKNNNENIFFLENGNKNCESACGC